jgi:hypothetical protein
MDGVPGPYTACWFNGIFRLGRAEGKGLIGYPLVPLSSAASEMAKSSFRQKLSRLHRLLGSDNAGERENARTAIDRIARIKKPGTI